MDPSGRSWRSGAIVEQRKLRQWFLKITDFADALVDDLDSLPEWPEQVKALQRSWIGRSHGTRITFPVGAGGGLALPTTTTLDAFTTRPDTLPGVTFLAVSPDHDLVTEVVGAARAAGGTALLDLVDRVTALQRACVATNNVEEGLLGNEKFEAIQLPVNVRHPMTGAEVGSCLSHRNVSAVCHPTFGNKLSVIGGSVFV